MEESARYIMFHAVIVLLAGLLAGIPYGRAILKNTNERLIGAQKMGIDHGFEKNQGVRLGYPHFSGIGQGQTTVFKKEDIWAQSRKHYLNHSVRFLD